MKRLVVGPVVVVAVAFAAIGIAKPPDGGGSTDARSFTIAGDVDGVVPGAGSLLPVELANPNRFALDVRTLDITVADAGPGCARTNLVVGPPPLPVAIPALGRAVVGVDVRFVDDPSDACQGAEFPITYRGTAMRVDPATPTPTLSPTPSATPKPSAAPTPKPKPTPKPR